jgi:hypothetical protein
MGLYKENKIQRIFENKNIWIIVGVIIGIAILGYLSTLINWGGMFEKDNIRVRFTESPLDLTKKDNTLMEITVFNNTENDLDNLEVKVKDVENTFIVFCPDAQGEDKTRVSIPKVAAGNQRIVTCNIRYDKTKDFFQGTYSFDIEYYIEDTIFTKRVNLEVRR